VRLARTLTVAALAAAGVLAAPGAASATPPCGVDCGTDAPYGVQTTMQQRLHYQTATGTARTSNAFELAIDAVLDQLNDVFGGDDQ
jgi:hypothetical protein